jgi:hypothetical protein
MKIALPRILLGAMVACLVAQVGCVRSTSHSAGPSSDPIARGVLSVEDAAAFAAQLANEQCERQYRRRPFKPGQNSAIFQDGLYRWGKLDVGGVGGFSAVVTFRQDGSEPHVEVYFSSDSAGLR